MTTESLTADKVRRHLESSHNISMLHEYCQKSQIPLPEWKPYSIPMAGNYQHGMVLSIMGQKFECNGAKTRADAKKTCAAAAVEYFENAQISWFVNRERNYVSLLFMLCAAANIPPPTYDTSGNSMFHAICNVNEDMYKSEYPHSRKAAAKEDASRQAFNALCSIPQISDRIFIQNPTFGAKIVNLSNQSVKHKSLNTFRHEFNISQENQDIGDYNILPRPGSSEFNNPQHIRFDHLQSPDFFKEEKLAVSHTQPHEEEQLSYVDLLWSYYEQNKLIGKPYYNYRPVNVDGNTHYKAQLIVGAKNKVSDVHAVKSDAAEQIAKQLYLELNPTLPSDVDMSSLQTASSLFNSSQTEVNINPPIDDYEDDVYISDGDLELPTYDSMLHNWLHKSKCLPPTFEFNKGQVGIKCTSSIINPVTGVVEKFTCLREHQRRATAREDVCHDMYCLLIANSMKYQ